VAKQPQPAGFVHRGKLSPLLSTDPWTEFFFLKRVLVMRSGKAIAAIASVAAVVCSIFVFSWVGLALLGF
jgi:hypothetical protein